MQTYNSFTISPPLVPLQVYALHAMTCAKQERLKKEEIEFSRITKEQDPTGSYESLFRSCVTDNQKKQLAQPPIISPFLDVNWAKKVRLKNLLIQSPIEISFNPFSPSIPLRLSFTDSKLN